VIGEMLKNAENRRWMEKKEEKHKKGAGGGLLWRHQDGQKAGQAQITAEWLLTDPNGD